MEICKIFGKFRPLKQTLYLRTIFQSEKWREILKRKLFIIGAGGKTHELIKILCSLCSFYKQKFEVCILDDSTIYEGSYPTNFYFKIKDKKSSKAKSLAQRI